MTTEISVYASLPRPTTHGVPRGVDIFFVLTIGDVDHEGQVTLLPHEDGRPGYGAWGSRDHWLDGRTVAMLRDRRDDRSILNTIEAACSEAAGS